MTKGLALAIVFALLVLEPLTACTMPREAQWIRETCFICGFTSGMYVSSRDAWYCYRHSELDGYHAQTPYERVQNWPCATGQIVMEE